MKTNTNFDHISLILLRMRKVSDECSGEIKTQILCSTFFSRISCRLWDNMEKYCRAEQTTYVDNMTHAGHLRIQTHTWNM